MKIVEAKVIVCSPGRNFVALKVTTEDGVYGWYDAQLVGRASRLKHGGVTGLRLRPL